MEKWKEITDFKKNSIKIHACYYFDEIVTFEDFDPDNILKDEKLHKYFSL